MKLLIFVIYLTGLVASETEQVTKRKGETVVLQVKEIQRILNDYIWTFGQNSPIKAIAVVTNKVAIVVNGTRFGTRLHLNVETGSLTISNLTFEDSGMFLIQILTETKTVTNEYNITVVDNNEPTINTLEGSNVMMETRVKQLDPNHHVNWTQGRDFKGKEIATWEHNIVKYDEVLKDFLSLDPKSGSLTIKNITKELSGFYCVTMLIGKEPHIMKQFEVMVYEVVSTPHLSVMEHGLHLDDPWSCHINCSVVNNLDVTVTWYKGRTVINRTTNPDQSSKLCLPLEIPRPTEDTYRCEAANPVSNESVSVNTYMCPTPQSVFPSAKVGVGVGLCFMFVVVPVIVVVMCKHKRRPCNINCVNMNTLENPSSQNSVESVRTEEEDYPPLIPTQ